MRGWAVLLLGLGLGLGCCLPVMAQQREPEPSAEQRCLQHLQGPEAQPEYPVELYKHNRGGRVQVELSFDGPQNMPSARVLLHEGDEALVESVRAHLRGLRVPCMPQGAAPAVLRQEYAFERDRRRVHWTRAQDVASGPGRPAWNCLEYRGRSAKPDYPQAALRVGLQGRVALRLTFDSPDAAPRIEPFSRPGMDTLTSSAERWAEAYRLPCLGDRPASTLVIFEFRVENDRYGFRNADLLQLLRATRGVREQALALDTRQMGCPFELQMLYLRPQLPNHVGEPGDPVPARRPLLEWLESVELELPRGSLDAVWGDRFKLAVPCVNIDIQPKEK